jgi:hypothetical protein
MGKTQVKKSAEVDEENNIDQKLLGAGGYQCLKVIGQYSYSKKEKQVVQYPVQMLRRKTGYNYHNAGNNIITGKHYLPKH